LPFEFRRTENFMRLGLRAKSALALLVCIGIVLALAAVAGWRAFGVVEENLGSAFARNLTRYNKQRLLTPITRELALSQRLADSELTRRFLLDENNPEKKRLFFAEAKGYQKAFDDHSYFLISALSRHYYFNDRSTPFSAQPRYSLSPKAAKDAWFFATLRATAPYSINVNVDPKLQVTKVWFNVKVKDGERDIGLAGSGLDLSAFLDRFIKNREDGVTPIIVNESGAIQAHPDRSLINYSSITDKGENASTIYRLLDEPGRDRMRAALQKARADAENIPTFRADLGEGRRLFAVAYIPQLKWFVVTAVDLQAARVLDNRLWLPFAAGGALLLLLLLAAIIFAVNRLILSPLLGLTGAVRGVAAGDYQTPLPPASNDELGELTRAFGAMAAQVRSHTDELETKVDERTRELATANAHMREANKKIGDSIQYASLIQNAILPEREMQQNLAGAHFVLWRPRDVVGGDFYIFRGAPGGCLLGVVDCAGHGVAGAFMTMIAHSALEVAVDTIGLSDPAALLQAMDARVRAALQTKPEYSAVATHMDAGLAYVDFEKHNVVFAGAKVSLYWCDGAATGEIKGDNHTLGGKRIADFQNHNTPLAGSTPDGNAAGADAAKRTFYLTTDGLLDQAGGNKGFSFGATRFMELMKRYAHLSLEEQRAAFARELEQYQGELAQRDDITLLGFRFD
jgi:serine phosphatase RsbU (regulator of sigma subunit)